MNNIKSAVLGLYNKVKENAKKVLVACLALVGVTLVASTPSYAAGSFDFTTIATAISTEITSDLPVFATIMGIVVGVPLVWSLFKRMAR
jgi:hypothetical protein